MLVSSDTENGVSSILQSGSTPHVDHCRSRTQFLDAVEPSPPPGSPCQRLAGPADRRAHCTQARRDTIYRLATQCSINTFFFIHNTSFLSY